MRLRNCWHDASIPCQLCAWELAWEWGFPSFCSLNRWMIGLIWLNDALLHRFFPLQSLTASLYDGDVVGWSAGQNEEQCFQCLVLSDQDLTVHLITWKQNLSGWIDGFFWWLEVFQQKPTFFYWVITLCAKSHRLSIGCDWEMSVQGSKGLMHKLTFG